MPILERNEYIADKLIASMLFPGDSESVFTSEEIYEDVDMATNPFHVYDMFCTDRAVGAVDGTDCEPIGVRSVDNDVGNNISIAGGVLVFAGGTGVTSQTEISFYNNDGDGIARADGLILEIDIVADNDKIMVVRTAPPANDHAFIFRDDGNIDINNLGVTVAPDVAPYDDGETYRLRFAIRNPGADYYISGGAFGELGKVFTLLWCSPDGANTPLAIQIRNNNAVFTADRVLYYS